MELTHDYDGETYELEVLKDEKDRLTHLAQLTIKNGPRTFKFAHLFRIKNSTSGKKILSIWKGKKSGSKIKEDKKKEIKIEKEEIQKLASFLDKSEEIPEVEPGSHILLKKDNPEAETAADAIESIRSINSSSAKNIAKKLIEELSEIEEKIDDKKELAENLPKNVDNIEKILKYNQQKSSLKKLKEKVNKELKEKEYQEFLEQNPWVFGSRYIRDSEKRELTRNSEVDFCLEATSGYYDIFEIKKPEHNVLVKDPSHNGYKPSAKLSEATSQIETYIKEIEEERSDILRHEKIDILKPRGYIVIGNSLSEEKKEHLRTHNSFMNRIRVLTYSDLIRIAERTIEIQKIEPN